jgi:hypothetical protein
MIVSAFKAKIGLNRVIVDVGEIDGARARDLLLNAEAGGIHAVITLMKVYDKQLGEAKLGAKRRASNAISSDENRPTSYFRTRNTSSANNAIILIRCPIPFRSSQRYRWGL